MSNDRMIADWLAWLASGNLSPNTIRLRRHAITHFARGRDLTTVTTADIVAYIGSRPGCSARLRRLRKQRPLTTARTRWGDITSSMTKHPPPWP